MNTLSALTGYFLGDCLGAPYEFSSAREIGRVSHTLQKSVFGHEPGRGTDDTELALCAGRAILQTPDHFPAAEYWLPELFAWQDTDPKDIGNSTRASLNDWRNGLDPFTTPEGQNRAGNGALILATVPALAQSNPHLAGQVAGHAALMTHPATSAVQAASLYGKLLAGGQFYPNDQRWLDQEGVKGGIGYAPRCLRIAWMSCDRVEKGTWSPITALVNVIKLGGDTDTNAAMAGALIGARTGCTWPEHLIDQLDPERLQEIIELARALDA